jgi:hypothetical protein
MSPNQLRSPRWSIQPPSLQVDSTIRFKQSGGSMATDDYEEVVSSGGLKLKGADFGKKKK